MRMIVVMCLITICSYAQKENYNILIGKQNCNKGNYCIIIDVCPENNSDMIWAVKWDNTYLNLYPKVREQLLIYYNAYILTCEDNIENRKQFIRDFNLK